MTRLKYPCPCCEYPTLDEEPPGTFEICGVCWWEDDGVQFHDPDRRGGANVPSLNEARRSFAQVGASEDVVRDRVRPPTDAERAHRGRVMIVQHPDSA